MSLKMLKPVIIADSGPLISLAIINQLDLLKQLFKRVIIPPAVWDEVTVKGRDMPGALAVSQVTWFEFKIPEQQILKPLSILIDPGESEAIALAQMIIESIVLLDDARARRVAERFDVPRIGTLGILRRAKINGLINNIKPYIDHLKENNIYMADNLVNAILKDVGE